MNIKPIVLYSNILPFVASIAINIAVNQATKGISSRDVEKELRIEQRQERIEALKKFFNSYKSPLLPHAETFVDVAEKYDLDYRLLPAISCMESSCGKNLIQGSYNPFGWGIYGTNAIYFKNYDEAIETVGKGLKDNYLARGFDTPEKIAPIYTPPNHVNWLYGVNFFTDKIDQAKKVI